MNINRTIIVPASLVVLARSIAEALAPGGVGMFQTPLYTGVNLTHYVSSGLIDSSFENALLDANALYAFCQAVIPPANATLAQCQDLIAQSIVVDCDVEDAYTTFARLGLTINGN